MEHLKAIRIKSRRGRRACRELCVEGNRQPKDEGNQECFHGSGHVRRNIASRRAKKNIAQERDATSSFPSFPALPTTQLMTHASGTRSATRPLLIALLLTLAITQAHAAAGSVKRRTIRTVSGLVLGEDTGRPLANALVRVASPSADMRFVREGDTPLHETRTDASGHFKLLLPEAGTFAIDVFSPGYLSAAGSFAHGGLEGVEELSFRREPGQELTLRLKRGLYAKGRVMDESGRPLREVSVLATMEMPNGMAYIARTRTDSRGDFEIFDFPSHPWDHCKGQLAFTHPSRIRSILPDVYLMGGTGQQDIRVMLRRGHDVRGTVYSNEGDPVRNTIVETVPIDRHAEYKQAITDHRGRFLLQGVGDGDFQIWVHSLTRHQKAKPRLHVQGQDARLDVHLQPVTLEPAPTPTSLLGMKLADLTPQLVEAYDLEQASGVLVLDPGKATGRPGFGILQEGCYFWTVGDRSVGNLREMVEEILRIEGLEKPLPGREQEGFKGWVRVVYSHRHGSMTTTLHLEETDVAELKRLHAVLQGRDPIH